MSVTAVRAVTCRSCTHPVEALTIESANPTRHPHFQHKLIDRTLLRMSCPHCGAAHLHADRLVWTDLPGRLCAIVLGDHETDQWAALEPEVIATLAPPLRDEGPPLVREWGAQVAIRMVFGFEELREKVLCRVHDLDDRVLECLKLAIGSPDARLESVVPGERLLLRTPEREHDLAWQRYLDLTARADDLAHAHPALFATTSAWINARRV